MAHQYTLIMSEPELERVYVGLLNQRAQEKEFLEKYQEDCSMEEIDSLTLSLKTIEDLIDTIQKGTRG